jgi:hypothetical protein
MRIRSQARAKGFFVPVQTETSHHSDAHAWSKRWIELT